MPRRCLSRPHEGRQQTLLTQTDEVLWRLDIPPGQLRGIKGYVNFRSLPAVKGEFVSCYTLEYVEAAELAEGN
jgi:hypothetical protein